jgi:hypothetical protein
MTTDSEPQPESAPSSSRSVTIRREAEEFQVLVRGVAAVQSADIEHLIAAASDLGMDNPLLLDRDVDLVLDLPLPDKAAVLAVVSEAASIQGELVAGRDEILDGADWEVEPIDTGNTVDGQPWGWFSPDGGAVFRLVPTAPSEAILGARASWIGAGMSTSLEVGVRSFDHSVAISWYSHEDGETKIWIDYEVEGWDAVMTRALRSMFDHSICPACEESEPWSITVRADAMFSVQALGDALTGIWCPCSQHRESGATLNEASRDWKWSDTTWVAA